MRVYLTGAIGFVGGWMRTELEGNGHQVVPAPGPDDLDIADRRGLAEWLSSAGAPEAVIHLAGMAFGPDASHDPSEAFRVNVGGTIALFEALGELRLAVPVLVSGSADVYGSPAAADLPLTERSPLAPLQSYALSKAAQEAAALEVAARHGIPVVVTRSFNHVGPGQRSVFVVAAMAERVLAVRRGEASSIPAGNVDVRRDLTDVRDVVRAYRLLLEGLAAGRFESRVVNVCSGRSRSIRWVIEQLCALAGVGPVITVDPSLVRAGDPPEIRGDWSLLHELTGWEPRTPLDRTLGDVLADAAERYARAR